MEELHIQNVSQIVDIVKEDDLHAEFREFDRQLNANLKRLRDELAKQVLSQDVPFLQSHMALVESWRERVSRYRALASTFVEHSKSSYFMLPSGKGRTEFDRKAYEKKLAAGFKGIFDYLDELLVCIDSRVNTCKKLLGLESEGFNPRIK